MPCRSPQREYLCLSQVAERVRTDARVTVLERTNLRHLRLSELPRARSVDFVTLDLSFISVVTVIDQLCTLMSPTAGLVVLIKPQFEAARHQVCSTLCEMHLPCRNLAYLSFMSKLASPFWGGLHGHLHLESSQGRQ